MRHAGSSADASAECTTSAALRCGTGGRVDPELLVVASALNEVQLGKVVGGIVLIDVEKSTHHIRPGRVSDGRAHSGELLTSATTGFGAGFGRGLNLCKLRERA